jgi:hypothetical protein
VSWLKDLSEGQLEMYMRRLEDALENMYVASAILADAGVTEGAVQDDLENARRIIWKLQDIARLALTSKKEQRWNEFRDCGVCHMARHIKSEKELTRVVWRELGLAGHNADIKRRRVAAEEVHKAYEYAMNNPPPVDEDEKGILLDAIAGLFISRINDMKREEFDMQFYEELLLTLSQIKRR